VADRLAIQVADAAKWRDHILEYFQGFSKRPFPRSASRRPAGARA
jgi:alpha-glucuronidase